MIERGIGREMVELALKRGSKTKQADGLLATYGYVRIAYRVSGKTFVVKAVMVKK